MRCWCESTRRSSSGQRRKLVRIAGDRLIAETAELIKRLARDNGGSFRYPLNRTRRRSTSQRLHNKMSPIAETSPTTSEAHAP